MKIRSEGLAVGLVFVAIATLACLAPAQGDTWWLLRAGREIWSTGTVPLSDSYSHTAVGRYWWNHEWLTEALFYGAFRLGGLPLVAALCASSIFAAWLLCWKMTRGSFEWRFVLLAASVVASAGSWALRPQAFSMLLFAAICRALVDGRRLAWIPLLVIVWVNFHGAAVLSLVAIAGAGAAASASARRAAWPFLRVFVASAVATGVSPVGFRLYPEILASVERSRINQLIEWLPPGAAPWLWPFWALVAAVPVTIAMRYRRMDERSRRLLGIAVAVLPLAVRSTRNVHLYLIAAIPAVTSAWSGPPRVAARVVPERERVNGAILISAAVVAAVFVAFVWTVPPPRSGWKPIGPEAARAVETCDGPLYNTYGTGGVLIWFTPGRPVFIDNRQDPYPDDLLRLNKALELDGRYEDVFARYGIRCAALPPFSPTTERLLADPAWVVTHRDAQWVVLKRRGL